MSKEHQIQTETVRLWDPLLRVFHWALAFCVIATFLLGKFGPDAMTLHFYLGYAIIGLLVFRIVWGFVGSRTARFSHFLFGPRKTLAYIATMPKRRPSFWPGHNPVGALSVFALIGVLALQAGTGLFIDADDFINTGPFADTISYENAREAAKLHYKLSFVVLGLTLVHLGAILFYRFWKSENLVKPMITGMKEVAKDHPDT
ncbi:cytochrome b/b6 domain-containing protein [Aliiroseovarius sp. F20344]|uniref:cytochrome b/b6 domain-containing protein n=1 Tax=Aliiroseovarius sp. F20344 TaxID=2926414 RepID=UPI001FF287EB|nr:cytochrome b/b6 domain-containing protein [Aliiroseovarius sp. F20344]MCK0142593.1 cytochrome b/b6 domain-containing protein [Aliiroseovarius sp. F20344]